MRDKLNIVSGDNSKLFWEMINKIDSSATHFDIGNTLYLMGCKMQELEAEIEKIRNGRAGK